jgi:putative heme-binding domain-containing protein
LAADRQGPPLLPRPNLAAMDIDSLRKEARSPERWNNHFARVELEARGQNDAWALDETDTSTLALRRLMREASTPDLWTMEPPSSFSHTSPLERLWWIIHSSRGFMENQATVRLKAVDLLPRLLSVLDLPTDRWIDFALSQYVRKTAPEWLPALTGGRLRIDHPGHLVYALQNSGDARALTLLVGPLMQGTLAPETASAVWRFAAQQGDEALLAEIFKAADPTPMGEPTLSALITAAEQRNVRAKGLEGQLSAWLAETRLPHPVRAKAAHLTGLWKMENERARLEALATAASEQTAVRLGALRGLAALGGDATAAFLTGFAANPSHAALRIPATRALLAVDVPAATRLTIALMQDPPDTAEVESLLSATVQAKNGPAALVAALRDQTIPATMAASGMRIAGSAGLRDTQLSDAFRAAGKLAPILTMPDEETLARLIARVASEGDAKRGEAVYRRAALLCVFCHAIGETGGQIGPNLQSIGASAQVDYLIESLLDPTAKIKEGYHTTAITTRDGRMLAGMLVKDGDPVVLRDAAGVEHTLAASQIERKDISPVSIMPPGLTASLAEPEFIDLVRFMAELGREGGVNLPPNQFVREWEALQADGSWLKIIARVDGSLDLAEAPGRSLKTRIELPAPVNVRFTSDANAKLTSNGNLVAGGTRALGAGPHDLLITWPAHPGSARLELIP